jgi:hypothetical protein
MLRKVTLSGVRDYPVILKHLRDHCPNLRSLTIFTRHLASFPRSYPVLYSILERLERFEISQHKNRRERPHVDVTEKLLQVLQVSNEPLKIKHIRFEYRVADYVKLKLLLSRFHFLVSIDIGINLENLAQMNLVDDDLPFWHSLECIKGLSMMGKVDWFQFGVNWITSKYSANVGLNLSFRSESELDDPIICDEVPLLRLMAPGRPSCADFLKFDIFNKLKKPINVSHFAEMIVGCMAGSGRARAGAARFSICSPLVPTQRTALAPTAHMQILLGMSGRLRAVSLSGVSDQICGASGRCPVSRIC